MSDSTRNLHPAPLVETPKQTKLLGAPTSLTERLEHLGLADLLTDYIARGCVGVQFVKLERLAHQHGYIFDREYGNIYGRLMLTPITTTRTPAFRIITRSDHDASHGLKRRAA